jgi:hypothetical protein
MVPTQASRNAMKCFTLSIGMANEVTLASNPVALTSRVRPSADGPPSKR